MKQSVSGTMLQKTTLVIGLFSAPTMVKEPTSQINWTVKNTRPEKQRDGTHLFYVALREA
jgi:hypothetical protein